MMGRRAGGIGAGKGRKGSKRTLARRGDEGEQTSEWLARRRPRTRGPRGSAPQQSADHNRAQHPRRSHPRAPVRCSASPASPPSRLSLAMCAHVFPRGAHALGVTDDHPSSRDRAPDMALCDRADAGHRRATQRGDQMLKLGRLEVAEALPGALRQKNDFPMALYGLGEVHTRAEDDDRVDLAESAHNSRWKTGRSTSTPTSPSATSRAPRAQRRRRRRLHEGARGRAGRRHGVGGAGTPPPRDVRFDKAKESYEKALTTATNGNRPRA